MLLTPGSLTRDDTVPPKHDSSTWKSGLAGRGASHCWVWLASSPKCWSCSPPLSSPLHSFFKMTAMRFHISEKSTIKWRTLIFSFRVVYPCFASSVTLQILQRSFILLTRPPLRIRNPALSVCALLSQLTHWFCKWRTFQMLSALHSYGGLWELRHSISQL